MVFSVIDGSASRLAIFVIITILEALCLISYYLVVAVGPGSPMEFPELRCLEPGPDVRPEPPEFLKSNTVMVKRDGGYRYCNKCRVWKPDRCHHCSSCEQCILRMDHHCPWFADCIGFKNHKFFVQFLIYTSFYTGLATLISGYCLYKIYYLQSVSLDKFSLHTMFVFALGAVMWLCVSVFTLFTIYQLLINRTTLESYETQGYRSNRNSHEIGNIFDLGYKQNWFAIMGATWVEWLLPIRASSENGSGLTFRVNDLVYRKLQQETQLQERLSQEITNYRAVQKQIHKSALPPA
ncbi:hypothetical protein KL925_003459 [Ogataea polymorpha]|nr:hypothetical protein KL925_003459 [Ogataea polymorpha]